LTEEVQVSCCEQFATSVHVTHESETPFWRNVPLSHVVHCDVVALVQVSAVVQKSI
jgi:hypothetical protein